jgi:hypothetical protein
VVEEFYNGPPVMGATVVKKRLETCYPNNGNFVKDDPMCIQQMNIIAFDQCKTKDPESKSYGAAKVCTIKSPSPNPKLMPHVVHIFRTMHKDTLKSSTTTIISMQLSKNSPRTHRR